MDWPSTAETKPQSIINKCYPHHNFCRPPAAAAAVATAATSATAAATAKHPPPSQQNYIIAASLSISVEMEVPGECAVPKPWEIPNLVLSLASSPDPNAQLLQHDLTTWFARLPAGKRGCQIKKVHCSLHLQSAHCILTKQYVRAIASPNFLISRNQDDGLDLSSPLYFCISGNQDAHVKV